MEELINEAKKHNIRIMMDLVLNHSSNEHRWFKEAKKSKDNPYHDYYIWRDGDEGVPPSDMKACFGGSSMGICAGNRTVLFPSVFTGAAGFKLGESKGQKSNIRYDSLVDGQGSRRLQT